MLASSRRRGFQPGLALLAAAALAATACSPSASGERASVRFAVSTSAADLGVVPVVRVSEVRTLSDHVNLLQPILTGTSGRDVTITVAHREQAGETFTMDSSSLESRAVAPYAYAARPSRRAPAPALLGDAPASVALQDGGSLSAWTDEASSRVFVQAFDANGAWRGSPVPVSPEGMAAFGAPQVVTSDGRRVVVAFFASNEERFKLVAASVESTR